MTPPPYAGLGRRCAALVLDILLLSLIFFPVTRAVKGVWIMSAADHRWNYRWLITDPLCLVFLGAMFLYFVLLEGTLGATLGKKLLGLRVAQPNGDVPGVQRAAIRNLLRVVDGLPAFSLLGAALIWRTRERTRVGDLVAGTRVTHRRREFDTPRASPR